MSDYYIHPSSFVDDNVSIGKGTKIWHNSQVLTGAKIGKDCTIGHNCFIGENVKIGNNVKIQSNTDVWSKITLEDFVFVGPSAVFTNDLNPRSKYPKPKEKWLPTRIQKGATIGANSTIVCGNIIGKWAFVGAGAVVTENVPDYALVAGVPAKIIGWMCECGSKLRFEPSRMCANKGANIREYKSANKYEYGKCEKCGRRYKKIGNTVSLIRTNNNSLIFANKN